MTSDLQAAARQLGLRLHVLHASPDDDFDTVFATLDQLRAGALVIGPDSLFFDRREQLGALTARRAMPAICPYRDFAVAGGLMSYGADISKMFRQVGVYTARVLNGERTTDLPVQQFTRIQFVLNLKIAKALGLTVPVTLLALADEVIE